MAGFIYFVDGMTPACRESELDKIGLRYAFPSTPDVRQACNGPGNQSGRVLARPGVSGRVGYFPDQQTWIPSENEQFWIGWENGAKPTPADLARDDQIPGEFVEMADGNEWLIPTARDFQEVDGFAEWYTLLPQKMQRRYGEWIQGDVIDRHRDLWIAAEECWNECLSAMSSGSGLLISMDCAVTALQTNYHVGFDEVSELGLLTSTGPHLMGIVNALTGLSKYMHWAQKKTSGNGATT